MNINTLTPTPPGWIELRCATLIARIRRSRWDSDCFDDAGWFVGQDAGNRSMRAAGRSKQAAASPPQAVCTIRRAGVDDGYSLTRFRRTKG